MKLTLLAVLLASTALTGAVFAQEVTSDPADQCPPNSGEFDTGVADAAAGKDRMYPNCKGYTEGYDYQLSQVGVVTTPTPVEATPVVTETPTPVEATPVVTETPTATPVAETPVIAPAVLAQITAKVEAAAAAPLAEDLGLGCAPGANLPGILRLGLIDGQIKTAMNAQYSTCTAYVTGFNEGRAQKFLRINLVQGINAAEQGAGCTVIESQLPYILGQGLIDGRTNKPLNTLYSSCASYITGYNEGKAQSASIKAISQAAKADVTAAPVPATPATPAAPTAEAEKPKPESPSDSHGSSSEKGSTEKSNGEKPDSDSGNSGNTSGGNKQSDAGTAEKAAEQETPDSDASRHTDDKMTNEGVSQEASKDVASDDAARGATTGKPDSGSSKSEGGTVSGAGPQ